MSWAGVVRSAAVADAVGRSERVRRLELRDEVGSTQDVALALDDPVGVLVIADRQRTGRGRHGRSWQDGPSPGASLAASIVLPDRADALGPLPLAVGLAVRDAASAALGAAPAAATLALRWPNDLVIGAAPGRKCAGVLVERRSVGTRPEAALVLAIGIGIDVDWSGSLPAPDVRGWTSLAEASGAPVDRETLVAALVRALDRWLDAAVSDVVAAHRRWSASLGRDVVVTAPDGGRRRGRAIDLAPDGALVLGVGGSRHEVRVGGVEDASLARPPDGPDREPGRG